MSTRLLKVDTSVNSPASSNGEAPLPAERSPRRDLTPPRRSYNRQLTPTRPAIRNPKVKKAASKRRGLVKSVSFSSVNYEILIPPYKPDEDDEEEEAKKEDSAAPKEADDVSGESDATKNAEEKNDNDASPRTAGERRPMRRAISENCLTRAQSTGRIKLDPAEKKALREARLKEAKQAAKNVRRQSRSGSSRKLNPDGEESATASDQPKEKGKGKSFLKKAFRRFNSFDASNLKAAMDADSSRPKSTKSQSTAMVAGKGRSPPPSPPKRLPARQLSVPPVLPAKERTDVVAAPAAPPPSPKEAAVAAPAPPPPSLPKEEKASNIKPSTSVEC